MYLGMKNLKTLAREAKTLARYVKKQMPRDVSQAWLWASQNAFLTETNPATGQKWRDRYGIVYGKRVRKIGNIEPYLSYGKLHRTGRLLKGLKVRRVINGNAVDIELYNKVPYAEEHETGKPTKRVTVKQPYVRGDVQGAVTGGKIVARPHMQPSKQILRSPRRLVLNKMRELGW